MPTISAIRVRVSRRGEVGAARGCAGCGSCRRRGPGPARVAEQVDARARSAARRRGGACGAARARPARRRCCSSSRRVHAEVAEPLDQPVQHVDGRPRVGQRAVVRASSSRGTAARASTACSWAPRRGSARGGRAARCRGARTPATSRPSASQPARRKPRSNGALCATSTAPRRTRGTPAAPSSIRGAPATIASVMPVSTAMNGGIDVAGLTSVWNSPSTSPPRTLTAPISVIVAALARAAGRLEVDDDERHLAQRRAELVERPLHRDEAPCGRERLRTRFGR